MSSDLLIETLRVAKVRSITRYISNPNLRQALLEEVVEKILHLDEDACYNSILKSSNINHRWGPQEDDEFERLMWQQWTRRVNGGGTIIQRDLARQLVDKYRAKEESRQRPAVIAETADPPQGSRRRQQRDKVLVQ